jgi:hypothetical protein
MTRERELLTEIHSRAILLSQITRNPVIATLVRNIVVDSEQALEVEAESQPKPRQGETHHPRHD